MKIKINKRDAVHGAMELIGCILMFYGYGSCVHDHGYKAGWHKGYSQGKSMQSNATIDAMTAMFGEDEGWARIRKEKAKWLMPTRRPSRRYLIL